MVFTSHTNFQPTIIGVTMWDPSDKPNWSTSNVFKLRHWHLSLAHTNFLVKVELAWVQGLGSSLKSSSRLATNTMNINYWTNVVQNKLISPLHVVWNNWDGAMNYPCLVTPLVIFLSFVSVTYGTPNIIFLRGVKFLGNLLSVNYSF